MDSSGMTTSEGLQLLQSFSNAVTELAESVSPSVVGINAGRRSGTGVVWSEDGLILTANHVVGRSVAPTIRLADGRELTGKVVGNDQYADVALVKVEVEGLRPVKRDGTDGVKVGQFVLALASSLGKTAATSGIVTSHRTKMQGFWGAVIDDAVVSDVKLNPGYSGGPLVDAHGRLLGMNVAYFASRGVALSTDALEETVSRIIKDEGVKKGILGVVVEQIELSEELATAAEVGQTGGLMVRAVEPGSPAKMAGVVIGDVILKLGGAVALDEYKLHKALSGGVVGKSTPLKVLRLEKVTELMVTPREAE